jgi:LacI family transcriptional regulator
MSTFRTVALLIGTSRAYDRGILRGITRYARTHGRWCFLHQDWRAGDELPAWLLNRRNDGIIARIEDKKMLDRLRKLHVPLVDVKTHHLPDVPVVGTNNRLTAKLAIDHLLERGLHRLAFCGYAGVGYSMERREHFVELAKQRHVQASVYEDDAPCGISATNSESGAMLYEQELAQWLTKLPKPIGLMACNDIRGLQVLNACRSRAIKVPEEIAVIGVDNDEVLCELADPPLSSVAPSADRIGYEAAAMLDATMAHKVSSDKIAAPKMRTEIDPEGVVVRGSTDVLVVEDRIISAAINFIRQHACEGIGVEDVLDYLAESHRAISRATLDRRFMEHLGCTSKSQIMQVRLAKVKQLLRDTDYSLARIANMVGIEYPQYLTVMFRNTTGKTPSQYRLQFAKLSSVGRG